MTATTASYNSQIGLLHVKFHPNQQDGHISQILNYGEEMGMKVGQGTIRVKGIEGEGRNGEGE